MRSLRVKLLLAFVAMALLAVVAMATAAVQIFEGRAREHARASFATAYHQLESSLKLRYAAFRAVSDLSYVLPVMRQVTGEATDESDFGLGTEQSDSDKLKTLHQNLVDADWGWAKMGKQGFFAVADYKGRLLYANTSQKSWGGDALKLDAVRQSFDPDSGHVGAMVIDAGDDTLRKPKVAGDGILPGLYVLFARATVLGGQPKAVFIQGIAANALLGDLALADSAMELALIAPYGGTAGTLPREVLKAADDLKRGDAVERTLSGKRWLMQRYALKGLDDKTVIADLVLAQNMSLSIALVLEGVQVMALFGSLLMVFALVVSILVAQRISRPVVALKEAADQVAAGDLGVQVRVQSRDEIGHLADSFNRMTEGLRERDRIKSTFKRYLAPDVVDYLLANPEAQSPGGERRRLTMLFSDLAGFTTFSEAHSPEQVVSVLNEYLGLVSDHLVARGGTLDKYMGDGVMAFFGAPLPRDDHAKGGVLAALDHLDVVKQVNVDLKEAGMPLLQVRVGLHTGDVICGNIGGEQAQDYTVIGDAVNLAARLEGVNKAYGTSVLVSEEVWQEVGEELDGRELDSVRVKGKSEAVRIYEVLGVSGWFAEHSDKAAVVERFNEGLIAYRDARFEAARAAFVAALDLDSADGPSRVFLARSERLLAEPPGEGWSHVWTLTSK